MTKIEDLLARRQRVLRAARLSYQRPFQPVRGEGYWLFDAAGRKYLDAYNNVPHVGHCNPRVVAALASQAATLSSNTRYLDELAVEYAERLVASMGEPLGAVIFTCTASEANDLAFRIASSVSGCTGVITTKNGYHGSTSLLAAIDGSAISPLKGDRWETVEAPPDSAAAGSQDASAFTVQMDQAISRLRKRGHSPAAFFFDSYFCSDGVRAPAPTFLNAAADELRRVGALIIADEVQAGLGRCGSHMWAFQRLGLRPDIVVLGKSLGNGYPVGAIVARPELVDFFYAKERYFNTCAGSQVAAAAGCAVLDVIRDEQLIGNAGRVGRLLKDELRRLSSRHPSIQSVRGEGLLLGVDLAPPQGSRESPGSFASRFVSDLMESGVVAGLTGPDRNARTVLKVRPPMVFDEPAVQFLIAALGVALTREEH